MLKKLMAFILFFAILVFIIPRSPLKGLLDEGERRFAQALLNHFGSEYFHGPARLKAVHLDKRLRLTVEGFEADFKIPKGSFPLEIASLRSENSLIGLLLKRPVLFDVKSIRFNRSQHEGVQGQALMQTGEAWRFAFNATIDGVGLEDIAPLSPETLSGSNGKMTGILNFKYDEANGPDFKLDAHGLEPGGNVPARFFDSLLPYLPHAATRQKIKQLEAFFPVVGYRRADLKMNLAEADKIKAFLHIYLPDYNLDLNLNLEIRIDEKNAFGKIAELMELLSK